MAEHEHVWIDAKNMAAGLALVEVPKVVTVCLHCGEETDRG